MEPYQERWDLSMWLLEVHVLPRTDLTSHEWGYSFTAQPGEQLGAAEKGRSFPTQTVRHPIHP